jgi:predicted nuclease of predicted toxin-antitoxin system
VAHYLIDANLPRRFALWAGGDCEFVHDLGADWSDSRIWTYASANGLTIVSKDADFSDRVLIRPAGPRVIHIRVGNLTLKDFQSYLDRVWDEVCRASDACRLVQVYRDRIETID